MSTNAQEIHPVPPSRSEPSVSISVAARESMGNVAADTSHSRNTLSVIGPTTGMRRILVVDDDEWICDVIARTLHRQRYLVQTVSSAEQALETLRSGVYDLLISDMMLTGMSGLDLTQRVSKIHPNLPVILITAHSDTDLMRDALRKGATDFIPKPFDIETIPMVIERSLERHALDQKRLLERDDEVMFTTVQALAAAIDAKEPMTAQHSQRVAQLCVTLAEALEMDRTQKRLVEFAAQVHDVGKIGVPDDILQKAGPLDETEWEAMRQHPVQGAAIVGRVEQLAVVADIVRHHHERIDGRGYPDGLQGQAIPLLARMISVADAYEVMTANRVYRGRLSEEAAIQRLREAAGTQFDADIVNVFIRLRPESISL